MTSRRLALFGTVLSALILAVLHPPACAADDKALEGSGAGVNVRMNASAADIGLPIYPQAQRRRDTAGESSAVSFGLWGGAFGLRVYAIQYRSDDKMEAIAEFYRHALERYGAVLDCSQPQSSDHPAADPKALTCDDDERGKGKQVLKVGSEADQRIVSLKALRDGVAFDMVRVRLHGD